MLDQRIKPNKNQKGKNVIHTLMIGKKICNSRHLQQYKRLYLSGFHEKPPRRYRSIFFVVVFLSFFLGNSCFSSSKTKEKKKKMQRSRNCKICGNEAIHACRLSISNLKVLFVFESSLLNNSISRFCDELVR